VSEEAEPGEWQMPNADPRERTYRVVVNHEEHYSIFAADRELPAGWRDAGVAGSRDACLAHIDAMLTGMRPLSPWVRMAEAGR
jgi:MbtH protein